MSYVSPFTGDVIQPTDVYYRAVALTANTQLNWPSNSTTNTDPAARIMNVTATGAYQLRMPAANQASVGQDALIRNVGGTTFSVTDYGGANVICTVAAGEAKYIYITANPTTTGTWGTIAFGAGSSSVDAAALAGYGLKAITTTLNQSHPVTSTASNFTADATYRAKTIVWTGGVGTISLSAAATLGDDWFVLVRNGGSGLLTIDPNGAELINGAANLAMQIDDSAIICCSGSAFFTVGLGQNTYFSYSQLVIPATTGTITLTPAQAQNTILKITGALTGPVTIQVPAAVQVYYVIDTATNYNVTFTTGVMGGANVTLTPGQQATLVCDATNLFNTTTIIAGALNITLNDGTLASPSLSFATELSTGMYRPNPGEIGWGILGFNRMLLTATGLSIQGTGNFTGGISGGSFP